jgi:hypothetical protein
MSVTLTITADSPQELLKAMAEFAATGKASASTKGKKKAAEDTETEEEDPFESDYTAGEQDTEEAPSLEKLRKVSAEKAEKGKREKIKAILTSFKVKALADLPEDKRASFLAKLEAL